jgi:phosphoribosyl 1,2-cyclic phosphate phosphodiesterase
MSELSVTILGSGSSGGVPRVGPHGPEWGDCDPHNPKNHRRRCSILVQRGGTNVLVDTSPDLREQLISAKCGTLDAVLITHDHADQVHGIDDLRMVAQNMRRRVDVYSDRATLDSVVAKFRYCFEAPVGSGYPPILNAHLLEANQTLTIKGSGGPIEAVPFLQDHGGMHSLGFRFGPVAYSSDVVGLSEESFALLSGVECWIVDALRYRPHPTHAHVALTLEWIARVKPRRAILTNLHIDLDYEALKRQLPPGTEPAFDGLCVTFAV